eukprot:747144_1
MRFAKKTLYLYFHHFTSSSMRFAKKPDYYLHPMATLPLGTAKCATTLEVAEVTIDNKPNESNRAKAFSSGFGATINLISTAVGGGGMFGNIYGASQLGIFGFVLITALSASFTYLSTEFLVSSCNISSNHSCYQLSEQYLGGKKGDILTKLFIIFGNWSFVVNVIQIFADFISYNFGIWLGIEGTTSFWNSREFAVILGLFFIFPWVQSKSIKSLEKLSGAFVLLCVIILIIIIVNAFRALSLDDLAPSIQLGPTSYQSFFRGLPAITWCWTVQFNVLPIYGTLTGRYKAQTMAHVSYWSWVSLFIYYMAFGFAVLIIWGTRINADFMTNLDYNDQNYVFYYGMELSTTTQFIMCIITFASIPIFAFEARTNLHYIAADVYHSLKTSDDYDADYSLTDLYHEETPLIGSKERDESWTEHVDYEENWIHRLIESGVIMASAAVVALYVTNLNWCLSLVGATYGCYIAYFLPSVVYWKAVSKENKLSTKQKILKCLSVICVLYGIMVCVLGITMAFV